MQKIAAGSSAFTAANLFVSKHIVCINRQFANKHTVAQYAFFWVGALKNNTRIIKAPVSLGIVAAKS